MKLVSKITAIGLISFVVAQINAISFTVINDTEEKVQIAICVENYKEPIIPITPEKAWRASIAGFDLQPGESHTLDLCYINPIAIHIGSRHFGNTPTAILVDDGATYHITRELVPMMAYKYSVNSEEVGKTEL